VGPCRQWKPHPSSYALVCWEHVILARHDVLPSCQLLLTTSSNLIFSVWTYETCSVNCFCLVTDVWDEVDIYKIFKTRVTWSGNHLTILMLRIHNDRIDTSVNTIVLTYIRIKSKCNMQYLTFDTALNYCKFIFVGGIERICTPLQVLLPTHNFVT
jgi:hypothetical protein